MRNLLVCFQKEVIFVSMFSWIKIQSKIVARETSWKEAYVVGDSLNRNQWESGFAWFNLVSLWQRRA